MALLRTQVQDQLSNMTALGMTTVKVNSAGRTMDIDPSKEVEFATDKDQVKIVPCRNDSCRRPMVVTTFFTPEKAECRACKGEAGPDAHVATVGVPIPGQTDPSKAVNLIGCLINEQLATAVCPICVEPMELKSVNHNDEYGPGHYQQTTKGAVWHQDAKGETTMHQCPRCMLVLTMSTTATHQFRRQNEARPGKNANAWAGVNGVREAAA